MKLWLLSLFSFFILPQLAGAAACCGGGFSAPSIIAGDDKAQLTTAYSRTDVTIDNVDARGIWRTQENHQQVQTLRIDGAHIFSDRWQAGFTLPIVQRSLGGQRFSAGQPLEQNHQGLGDVSASVGYEYLPDWDYNPYRPKGMGYFQLTAPTGKSRAESEAGGLDSRGNGFWAVGLGTILTKAVGPYDIFSNFEVHRSFAKSISNSQIQGTLEPGFGRTVGFGGGFNLKSLRFGGAVNWTHEDAINIAGNFPSKGSAEEYATAIFSASYLVSDEWANTLSYSDQTLVGQPMNTSLGKTVALVVQRRWGR